MGIELIIVLGIIIIPLIAEAKINNSYNKYSKINNGSGLTGKEAAERILLNNGLSYVKVKEVPGNLTDHYDPRTKTVNLSTNIYNNKTIASVSVAAHECGHAIQDKEAYSFLRLRSSMVPVVNFSSRISTILLFLGFILSIGDLIYLGIILMTAGLLFQLVTLPVEFDASNRAKKQLTKTGIVTKEELKGTNKVLKSAALTYVAGFLATALQILRYIVILKGDRK